MKHEAWGLWRCLSSSVRGLWVSLHMHTPHISVLQNGATHVVDSQLQQISVPLNLLPTNLQHLIFSTRFRNCKNSKCFTLYQPVTHFTNSTMSKTLLWYVIWQCIGLFWLALRIITTLLQVNKECKVRGFESENDEELTITMGNVLFVCRFKKQTSKKTGVWGKSFSI